MPTAQGTPVKGTVSRGGCIALGMSLGYAIQTAMFVFLRLGVFTLDQTMTPAGLQALASERHAMRARRAAAFLRRHFGPRIQHLNDDDLMEYAAERLRDFGQWGLANEKDQFSALPLAVYWGRGWQTDHMPGGLAALAGSWAQPQTPRQQLSQSLAALDLWHEALLDDLSDRNRVASILHELYSSPRAIVERGRDAHRWCAEFAPRIWTMMPDNTRYGHCTTAAAIAARYLPDFQDHVLFACIGLILGVRFAEIRFTRSLRLRSRWSRRPPISGSHLETPCSPTGNRSPGQHEND